MRWLLTLDRMLSARKRCGMPPAAHFLCCAKEKGERPRLFFIVTYLGSTTACPRFAYTLPCILNKRSDPSYCNGGLLYRKCLHLEKDRFIEPVATGCRGRHPLHFKSSALRTPSFIIFALQSPIWRGFFFRAVARCAPLRRSRGSAYGRDGSPVPYGHAKSLRKVLQFCVWRSIIYLNMYIGGVLVSLW